VRTAVEILTAVRKIAPATLSLGGANAKTIDRDWGTDSLRRGLEEGLSADEIIRRWEPGVREFLAERKKYLLY